MLQFPSEAGGLNPFPNLRPRPKPENDRTRFATQARAHCF